MTDLIRVRHKISGAIAEVPENIVNHFVFGQYLEEVGPEAKPYLPEMHRVSHPKDPTEDEIAVALQYNAITEEEAKSIRKAAAKPSAKTTAKTTEDLEAERVALDEAQTKDKK
jgi:hypothetical protein